MPRRTSTRPAEKPAPATISAPVAPLGVARALLAPAVAVLAVVLVFLAMHMNQAVDTYLALAAGTHFRTHGVTLGDPFSFASRRPDPVAGAPTPAPQGSWLHPVGWIDQNWLSQVAMSWLAGLFGLNALVLAKLLLYLLAAAGIVLGARIRGATMLTGVAVAVVVLLVCRSYLEIRPADVTNLAVVVLAVIVAAATRRNSRYFWVLVPFLALWCNLHSGFVFAFIVMAILVLAIITAVPDTILWLPRVMGYKG